VAISAEWKVIDTKLPVRAITYEHAEKGSVVKSQKVLKIAFDDYKKAAQYLDKLIKLDTLCTAEDQYIVMTKKITPQHAASYLLEQKMIDQPCFDELQREMKQYRGNNGGNDDKFSR